jgi:SAM-dependent methyltransferase
MHDHTLFNPDRAQLLNDVSRLQTQVSENELVRFLALRGDEDVADLGSGSGFYTNIVAGLTSGVVYAIELQPKMIEAYRERGLPGNVHIVESDLRHLPLPPRSIDVAYSIAVYHEVQGNLGLDGLLPLLREPGRLVIFDWRTDPESWESGPPASIRFDKTRVADSLRPYFQRVDATNVGRFMFAVTASGKLKQSS